MDEISNSTSKIRSSQRPSKSCISCAKRRVRCDKKLPCQQCVSRGLGGGCRRETVWVKGVVVESSPSVCLFMMMKISAHIVRTSLKNSNPNYEELLRENQELKEQLRNAATVPASTTPRLNEILNITERFEEDLFDVGNEPSRISTVTDAEAIIWPSAQCVQSFLSYGKTWTSWIHCALHHPTFERECAAFLGGGRSSSNVDDRHPLWLAVFFSFMCVGRSDLQAILGRMADFCCLAGHANIYGRGRGYCIWSFCGYVIIPLCRYMKLTRAL